eukprot:2321941-Amphidinium_carterae.1
MELPLTFQRNALAFLHTFCLKMSHQCSLCWTQIRYPERSNKKTWERANAQQLKNTFGHHKHEKQQMNTALNCCAPPLHRRKVRRYRPFAKVWEHSEARTAQQSKDEAH